MSPAIVRFWQKVHKTESCWLWTRMLDKDGYGGFTLDGSKQRAHRVAWEISFGEIPAGMFVCHRCDIPRCVNPEHLFLGTHVENMVDRTTKCRCANQKGVINPQAKLTEDDVLDIRTVYAFGALQRDIAKAYGVCQQTISNAVIGTSWSHL